MVTVALPEFDLSTLAEVLFASPLQPSERPSPAAIRATIETQLRACHGNVMSFAGNLAQEAGERPELCAARMRWVRHSVARAYPDRFAEHTGTAAFCRIAA